MDFKSGSWLGALTGTNGLSWGRAYSAKLGEFKRNLPSVGRISDFAAYRPNYYYYFIWSVLKRRSRVRGSLLLLIPRSATSSFTFDKWWCCRRPHVTQNKVDTVLMMATVSIILADGVFRTGPVRFYCWVVVVHGNYKSEWKSCWNYTILDQFRLK